MKKIKKIVTSRFFISAFVILLEFAQLLAVFIILNIFSTIMVVLSYIFNFCVLLYVINREEIPELKLPWLILILLLPIFGAYIFILFNGNEQTKKLKKAFDKTAEKLSPYRQQNPAIEELQEQNMDAYLQANYIYRTADMPYRNCSKVTYYRIGEEFFEALLEALDKAEHFIFMEYFIIEKGIMWDSIHNILVQKERYDVEFAVHKRGGIFICLLQGLIVNRHMHNPIISLFKKISFLDAMVSIVVTQCSLLTMSEVAEAVSSSALFGGVSLLFLLIGILTLLN